MRKSRQLLKEARRALVAALVFSGAINLLVLALPIYTLQIFETVVPAGSLETLVALVEGWVDDVVTQTTAALMPDSSALLETVRRRRASGGPAETALKMLLNLELRPRRVRDAANVWAALRAAQGVEGRDAAWAHPDLVPTTADLDDPLGYAERGRPEDRTAGSDDLDDQLRRLLDEEGGR